jgi:hypothetical protein
MVHLGSTVSDVVELVADGDVVPVWEVPDFAHIEAGGYTTLPAGVRRAARSWNRLGLELYKRSVRDSDGDLMDVLLGLFGGRPALALGISPAPEDKSTFQGITKRGPYSLEHMEDALAFVCSIPEGTDASALDELSQRMVDDFAAEWAKLRPTGSAPAETPALPLERDGRSIWDRLEAASEESTASRPFYWPALAVYTTTERVRESVSEPDSTFETVNTLAHQLRAKRGSGFEYSWRASGDASISPSWLSIQSASLDPETGRAVASGHLAHEVWNFAPAHDLGAIDGRNAFSFTEQGHPGGLFMPSSSLYAGSALSGAFIPLDAGVNVISVDLHGPTGTVASLEYLGGSTGAASIYDTLGTRRLLTVFEGIAGNEPIRFSGDGLWLLVTGSRASTLIDTVTGRSLALEVGNAAWWPLEDSSLLTVENENRTAVPRLFSLATNVYTRSFPPITLNVPVLKEFSYFWFPSVSPDGNEVLALTPAGVTADYQRQHGAGHHLVRINLDNGQGELIQRPFLDPAETLERDVRETRWTQRPPQHPVRLHPDLAVKVDEPTTEHEYLQPGRWAEQAEAILVNSLNRAIDLAKADLPVAHLMPEVLASLIPIAHDPAVWERQSKWLLDLQKATLALAAQGTRSAAEAAAWHSYGSAIAAIQAGRPDLIDPLTAQLQTL